MSSSSPWSELFRTVWNEVSYVGSYLRRTLYASTAQWDSIDKAKSASNIMVLLHGLRGTNRHYDEFYELKLQHSSKIAWLAPNVPERGNAPLAQVVRQLFEDLGAKDWKEGARVCLVGVSNGARVALGLRQLLGPKHPVHIISVVGPLHGTKMMDKLVSMTSPRVRNAFLPYHPQVYEEMQWGGINDEILNAALAIPRTTLKAFAGKYDHLVSEQPETSTVTPYHGHFSTLSHFRNEIVANAMNFFHRIFCDPAILQVIQDGTRLSTHEFLKLVFPPTGIRLDPDQWRILKIDFEDKITLEQFFALLAGPNTFYGDLNFTPGRNCHPFDLEPVNQIFLKVEADPQAFLPPSPEAPSDA